MPRFHSSIDLKDKVFIWQLMSCEAVFHEALHPRPQRHQTKPEAFPDGLRVLFNFVQIGLTSCRPLEASRLLRKRYTWHPRRFESRSWWWVRRRYRLSLKSRAATVRTVSSSCASPPEGRARWTLKLLAGAMVKLTEHKSLSHETVRRRLAENGLKPWRKDRWRIPQVDGEYVARMEDVLDLYAEAPDPKRPVICFDESPVQLIGEARQPIPAAPGQLERYDYEYRRNGTVNLFVVLDVHRPWRKVKVTERRAAEDYAQCMRELVDVHYPDAEYIRVVQDNLSTHSGGALYQAFPPAEARRILRRLEFHYTPRHASWLNIVEIEIGVLRGQCLDRRIADPKRLRREIAAWERQRNAARARIKWMFTTDKARAKMGHAYPDTSKES
jgi:DDE superfamily endonuclease